MNSGTWPDLDSRMLRNDLLRFAFGRADVRTISNPPRYTLASIADLRSYEQGLALFCEVRAIL